MANWNIFRRRAKVEERSIHNPAKPLRAVDIVTLLGGTQTESGVSVNEDNALKLATFNACVRRISFDLGLLPFPIYQKTDMGRVKASDHPIYNLIHSQANENTTSQVLRETVTAHVLRYGNGFCFIEKEGVRPVGLYPLNPIVTSAFRDGGRLLYGTKLRDGTKQVLTPDQVLHIPGLSFDGISGRSVIEESASVLGVALASETFAAKFWANGMALKSYLSHPGRISKDAKEHLKLSMASFTGCENAHGTPLFEEGMILKDVGLSPEASQFLETRVHNAREVSRLFLMPPSKVCDYERATWNNVESMNLDYLQSTLMRWIRAWENEINRKLFLEVEKNEFYAEMNVDGLLRGDQTTRYGNYQKGIQGGWLSINIIKEWENLNRIEGGDNHLSPLNMVPTQDRTAPQEPTQQRSLTPIVEDARKRLLTKETNAIKRALKKYTNREEFDTWAEAFYAEHKTLCKEVYLPIIQEESLCEAIAERHVNESLNAVAGIESVESEQWELRCKTKK